ncbi:hypothetical protein Q5L94_04350 [Idiomarina sp. Sol25]|uniref:hypothetical protein n=1 Tax=Idiomarina sp. Sol25 TaxID=3064000 RepID=UPI00294AD783|nr:hypothetical protein [Idiomarina sp. Sol25]MDV6327278.1 hypothetical protein [Idiomarina sp. Sol25]
MKKWIVAPLAAVVLSACMSTSNENAATLDRNQAVADLSVQMEDLGFNRVEIQPGVDEFLNICASILERQYSVMGEYRTQTENYVDVQAFLTAHQGKSEGELRDAIAAFDEKAQAEDEKIGPKLAAYNSAIESVSDQNAKLATEITLQLAQAAIILKDHSSTVAKAASIGTVSGWMSGNEQSADNNLGLAILRAKDQIDLASDANEIITLEQETIEAINSLQDELEAKG